VALSFSLPSEAVAVACVHRWIKVTETCHGRGCCVVEVLVLSPLLIAVATCIKLTDRGPVLFWQKRVGKWGQEFPFPEFRSILVNAEQLKDELIDDGGQTVTFKMKRDLRVTAIGRIIRKFSIDELPQLWCVLRGKMSLVGARPPVPCEVEVWRIVGDWMRLRD